MLGVDKQKELPYRDGFDLRSRAFVTELDNSLGYLDTLIFSAKYYIAVLAFLLYGPVC